MKKKQSRLNVAIVLLILAIVIVVALDVKIFRERTASFVESHPYVLSEDNRVSLDTGAENHTENAEAVEGTEASETEAPLPPAVSNGESSATSGVFSEIFGGD